MVKKVQLPVIGGVRKTVTIPDAQANQGTTIAGLAGQTITVAQLAQLMGVQQQKPNTQGGGSGTQAALIVGPGLSGGGSLVGAVPLNLIAPIPAFVFEDGGGGGGDGDPGPPGQNGATGSQGPMGPAVFFLPDDPEPALDAVPGAVGPTGSTGASGPMGPAVFMSAEDGEDGWHAIPGNQGATGAAGVSGLPGPAIFMIGDDGQDGEPGPPGPAGTGGGSGPTPSNNQPDGINVVMPLVTGSSNTNWSNYTVTVKVPGSQLLHSVNKWKMVFQLASGNVDLSSVRVLRTLAGSTTIIDTTNVTWGGVLNPTLGASGAINPSDPVALALDPQHDYYIQYYMATTTNNTAVGLYQASAAGTFNAFTESHTNSDIRGTIPGSFSNQSMAITQIYTSGDTAGYSGQVQPDGMNLVFPASSPSTSSSWSNYTINFKIAGNALLHSVTGGWQFPFVIAATKSADISKAIIRRTLAGSTTVIDTTNVTWGGITVQTLTAGNNYCDKITAYGLDPQHDYYIQVYLGSSTNNTNLTVNTGTAPTLMGATSGGYNSGDNTATALGSLSLTTTLYGLGALAVLSKA